MGEDTAEFAQRLDDLEDQIDEQHKLMKDTNRIVREMRRTGRIAFWFKVILWIIVLGLPIFFLKPILQYFTALTGVPVPTNTSVFGIPSSEEIQKAIAQYKAKGTPSP